MQSRRFCARQRHGSILDATGRGYVVKGSDGGIYTVVKVPVDTYMYEPDDLIALDAEAWCDQAGCWLGSTQEQCISMLTNPQLTYLLNKPFSDKLKELAEGVVAAGSEDLGHDFLNNFGISAKAFCKENIAVATRQALNHSIKVPVLYCSEGPVLFSKEEAAKRDENTQEILDMALTFIEFPERVNVDELAAKLLRAGAKHIPAQLDGLEL